MITAWWDRNHYWSDIILKIETAARLGDDRKLLGLHYDYNLGTISKAILLPVPKKSDKRTVIIIEKSAY